MEKSSRPPLFTVSASVEAIRDHLRGEPVAPSEMIRTLLTLHADYGAGRAGDLLPWAQSPEERRPLDDWLLDISRLFEPHQLDGRLVIIGLVLLVPELLPWLEQNDFFPALWHECEPAVTSILSPLGRNALDHIQHRAVRERAEDAGSGEELESSLPSGEGSVLEEMVAEAVPDLLEIEDHEAAAAEGEGTAVNGGGAAPDLQAPLRQARRLEAAMPEAVRVGQTTELLVMLPRLQSEGLRAELPIETVGGEIIDQGDVTDRQAELVFPAPDIPLVVYMLVQVSEHDFEVEVPFRGILVYPDRDGDYETFFLTPLRVLDRAPVAVRLYEDEQRTKPLSSVRLATTIAADVPGTDPQLAGLRAALVYAAAAGPVTINYSYVGGDQINATISDSSGVALGREASAVVSSQGDAGRIQVVRLFTPLLALVASQAPGNLQVAVIGDVQALQEEVERGAGADDGRIAGLVQKLSAAVPAARPTIIALFADPLVATAVGIVTRPVLDGLAQG